MDFSKNLPLGWELCLLDDVIVRISNGANVTQYEDKIGYPICRIETIWNQGVDLERVKYVKEKDTDFVKKYALQYGDILLSHINSDAHLGKTGIFKNQTDVLIHGINTLLIRPSKEINADFLNYQFNYIRTNGGFIDIAQRSVNQSSVNQGKLKKLNIHLPPLNEQQRIVAKIEELFSELDQGIDNLKTAQAQLKVYRQALLKHAFEGKLTAEWRAQNADKLESASALQQRIQHAREQRYQQQLAEWQTNGKQGSKPKAPKPISPLTAEELAELPELPEGWGWMKSGEFFESVTSGSRGWAEYYADSGAVFLRITNLDFDTLELDLESNKVQYVQPPSGAEGLRTKVQEGDFLFSITGYLGMFAIAPALEEAYVNQHISLARPLNEFSKQYFGYYVTSHTGGMRYLNNQTKGAVKAGLGLDDIQNFPVPICSLSEQMKIAEELKLRLSKINQLHQTITTSLQQAEALRQSILKKAFSGELVPQDPNDEPASVLLARIKADKECAGKLKAKPNLGEESVR